MREREKVLQSLEGVYREAYQAARERADQAEMSRLDFGFQRDQLGLEVLMDIRDLLTVSEAEPEKGTSLLERAQALRNLTRLR